MIVPLAQVLWRAPDALPLAVLVAVAVVAAVVWLYPAQVRRLRWPWRWVLPGLRAAALLGLVVSLLRPVAMRAKTVEERGAVLVLVDRSRSMGVVDRGRSPAQLIALADGLGRLPPGLRDRLTADLVADLDRLKALADELQRARVDLDYANLSGRGVEAARGRFEQTTARLTAAADATAARAAPFPEEAEVRRRLTELAAGARLPPRGEGRRRNWVAEVRGRAEDAAVAARAAQADADTRLYATDAEARAVADEVAGLSRLGLAEQALLRPGTGLLPALAGRVPVFPFAFDAAPSPLSLVEGDDVKPFFTFDPDGLASDVAGAVPEALGRLGNRPVRAVVIYSDGRQVGGEGAGVVAGLSAGGVPVYAVSVAGGGTPPDLAFRRVSLPESAFVGETVTVRADLRATVGAAPGRGGAPRPEWVDVRLRAAGVVQTRRVELGQGGTTAAAEFTLKLTRPGAHRVTLSVAPVEGEATPDNNQVERWIKVLPDRMKVAAFAGSPGWDFQHLRNALARTPWVELASAVLDPRAARVGLTPGEIRELDVLVLSDVPVAALDQEQWKAVDDLVTRRGGSVILVAGQAHLPTRWHGPNYLAAALLPFLPDYRPAWRVFPGEQPWFRFGPTPQAAREDVLRLGGALDAGPDSSAWQSLPGVYRYLGIPTAKLKANTVPLLVEAETATPVVTRSRLGAGRVLFVGLDETWRWRAKTDGATFDQFWLQLVRHAAGASYAATAGGVALDVSKVAAAPDEPVEVYARVRPGGGGGGGGGGGAGPSPTTAPTHPARVELNVLRNGVPVRTQPLAPADDAGTGRYSATLRGLAEGEYRLQLVVGGTTEPAVEVPLHVAPSAEAELSNVSGDDRSLRRLAEASGGRLLPVEHVDQLPDLLSARVEAGSRYGELSLWDSPYLFVFVVACLGVEWALRKRFGMA